jgi:hypothetical protein
MQKVYVTRGEQVTKTMPYSEVCMSMRVAGKPMHCIMGDNGMVQLFDRDGNKFSFPITSGEAGFYSDANGIYYNEGE